MLQADLSQAGAVVQPWWRFPAPMVMSCPNGDQWHSEGSQTGQKYSFYLHQLQRRELACFFPQPVRTIMRAHSTFAASRGSTMRSAIRACPSPSTGRSMLQVRNAQGDLATVTITKSSP
eukprot:gene9711-7579_t